MGGVSKEVKKGVHFLTYLGSRKLKTHRIIVVEPTEDVYEIKITCFCVVQPSNGICRSNFIAV